MKKLIIIILIGTSGSVFGQDSLRAGVKYGILPVLSFNSDDGILIGGEVKRYDYRSTLPYKSFTRIAFNYKTDGAFAFTLKRNQVDVFGTDLRASSTLFTGQNYNDYYLGNTDEIGFDDSRFDSTSYYNFKSFRIEVGAFSRIPISLASKTERIDFKAGLRFVYENPWGAAENKFLFDTNISGNNGSLLTLIDLGVIFENRKSEFRSQEGYFLEAGFSYAPPVISTNHTLENHLYALAFIPLTKRIIPITLATKVRFQNTVGDTPYWFTPFLGGGTSLRGYMYRRFTSNNALSYSLELRSWLFKIPYKNIELGGHVFMDGGRVFSNNNWDQIFIEHSFTFGFGGEMSIFTPDYIMKAEIGFSEEGIGIYLGTGYSF